MDNGFCPILLSSTPSTTTCYSSLKELYCPHNSYTSPRVFCGSLNSKGIKRVWSSSYPQNRDNDLRWPLHHKLLLLNYYS